jgi:hypothetical protein
MFPHLIPQTEYMFKRCRKDKFSKHLNEVDGECCKLIHQGQYYQFTLFLFNTKSTDKKFPSDWFIQKVFYSIVKFKAIPF